MAITLHGHPSNARTAGRAQTSQWRRCLMLSMLILAPSGQLEGNPLGGAETSEFARASSAGNGAQAGLAEDVADGSNCQSFISVQICSRSIQNPEFVWKCGLRTESRTFTERGLRFFEERWLKGIQILRCFCILCYQGKPEKKVTQG